MGKKSVKWVGKSMYIRLVCGEGCLGEYRTHGLGGPVIGGDGRRDEVGEGESSEAYSLRIPNEGGVSLVEKQQHCTTPPSPPLPNL